MVTKYHFCKPLPTKFLALIEIHSQINFLADGLTHCYFWNEILFSIHISNWNYRLAEDSESVMIQIVWLDNKFHRILQSWLHKELKECPLFCTVWQLVIKVIIHKLSGEQFLWNCFWNLEWFWAVGSTQKYTT